MEAGIDAAKIHPKPVGKLVHEIFGPTDHAKRVQSLANALVGTTHAAVLGIHAIGQVYAQAAGFTSKSGVKQIDRRPGNSNMMLDCLSKDRVGLVVRIRTEIVVALDVTPVPTSNGPSAAASTSRHARPASLTANAYGLPNVLESTIVVTNVCGSSR